MPTFEITTPEGKVLEVTAPEGATKEQALAYAQANYKPASSTPPASAVDRTNAAITGVNRGITGLLGLPMDTVQNVYNLGKAAVGSVANAAGRPDLAPDLTRATPLSSEWIANKLKGVGINTDNPRPDDTISRMLHTGGTVVGGSMVPGARPLPTALSAAGAAIGGELSDNPLAPALGAMVPGAVAQAGSEIKAGLANPKTAQTNVQQFERAGAGTPSVGQATESTFFRALENLVSRFPGGVGYLRRFAEGQQKGMGQIDPGVSAEDAGRAIEKGVRGANGFIDRTKQVWKRLDDNVANRVGNPQVVPAESLRTLQDLTTATAGAENTTTPLINGRLAQLRSGMEADLAKNPQGLPYQALRQIRTAVGDMLEDSLVAGVPQAQVRRVYGALSQDLEAAANAAGAGREFARQNAYYSARMSRIEDVLNRVIGDGKQPEDIFKTVMPTDPNQANKLRAVMRSLPVDEQRVVTEAVVSRLGRATPGKQNAVGDVFSPETFLTNWNRLSPGAKTQLFPDTQMRGNLDAVASVSSNIREGSKVFANPSGTAGAAAPYGLTAMAATGNLLPAAGLIAGANIGARMLTSPRVVRWLATASRAPTEAMPVQLGRLSVIFNESKDEQLKAELAGYLAGKGN